jgi:trigger factor
MQVSVESISKLERRMQVQVPAERVSQEVAARLQNLSRTARLKGFRPGKAPIKVIRQQFRRAGAPRGDRRIAAIQLCRGGV